MLKEQQNVYQQPFTSLAIDNIKKIQSDKHYDASQLEQTAKGIKEEKRYNDGSLSPVPIPVQDAGYLGTVAITQ